MQCVLNMCDNERHLCIHPLVKSYSQSYAVPVDEISAYVTVVDSCLADLKRVYVRPPSISTNFTPMPQITWRELLLFWYQVQIIRIS